VPMATIIALSSSLGMAVLLFGRRKLVHAVEPEPVAIGH